MPEGYTEDQRGKPGGFVADPDVMDTWATSSLTPELAAGWEDDPDLFARVFPMDLRPQAFEIIRTWLFSTIVRSHFEFDALPWTDAAISGWVLDPDRKKMSKSKGNVVTPMEPIRQFGADAMRYWAASGRPGVDTAVDEGQMKVGRRLAIKILNASKFALGVMGDDGPAGLERASDAITEPLDRSMLASLAALVANATTSFETYDYARALDATERFFWSFCDDYLELVKGRAYAGSDSARAALSAALDTLLRLFAPHMPFVTEEVWSWWREGSIHRAPWPVADDLAAFAGDDVAIYPAAAAVLGALRKAKSEAKRSMRTDVTAVVVRGPAELRRALEPAISDVRDGGRVVGELELADAAELGVDVTLARRPKRRRKRDDRPAIRPRLARRPHQPRDRRRSAGAGGVGKRLLAVERERPLMDLLGSPESEYPVVHLTGTNGKTSVARMTAALLEAAGLSVGAYTSPHLARVNERMVWNGEPISDDELDELLVAVAAIEDLLPDAPSYFEILTAVALRWFGDIAVDVAVVEVGLGGTGDATNVVDADVAVVTNVSIDHVEYLGPTLADIADEKAGIVEPTSALVLGETDPALVPYFLARGPGVGRASRHRLRCAREPARHRRPRRRPLHTARGSTTMCSSRCTARTKPTTRRSRSRPPSRSSAARSTPSSSPTRSPPCAHPDASKSSVTNRSCCSTARRTSPARTRCTRRWPTSSPTRRARSSSD